MPLRTYKLNPASASTFKGTAFDSLTSFTLEESGDEVAMGADGYDRIQRVHMENLAFVVTVNGMNTSRSISVGDCGALVLNCIERLDCAAGGSADTITFTFSNATCTSTNNTVSHTGASEVSYTFKCFKTDGTTPLTIT